MSESLRPVRDAHRFDESRLAEYLSEHLPGFAPPLAIRQFEVAEAGTYDLTAALLEPQEVTIGSITLQVRRNVTETSLPLLVGGIACLLLGIFGLAVALRRRR